MSIQMTDQQRIELENKSMIPKSVELCQATITHSENKEYQNSSNEDFQPTSYEKSVEKDIRGSFAAEANINTLRYKLSSHHGRSLIATLGLIIGVMTGFIISVSIPDTLTADQLGTIYIGSYIFYILLAGIKNDLHAYLCNISHGTNFERQYNGIKRLIGNFQLKATCYHYETRYHTRTVTDKQGRSHQQTYTTTQKVITHSDSKTVTPSKTKDISGQVDRIRAKKTIVFIKFQLEHQFADYQSRVNLDRIYTQFRSRNCHDVHQEYSCDYEVPGLIEKQAFYVGTLDCHYQLWFYVFGMLGLVWPYSMWVENKVDRFSLPITKVVTI